MRKDLVAALLVSAAIALFGILVSPAHALPVSISLIGLITEATGPEPVGGVSVGESYTAEITYESTAIVGIGDESILFDGLTLVDASILLMLGDSVFTETSNGVSINSLAFRDGALIGYNYRLGQFNPPSGASYFIFFEDGNLSQQVSFLPLGVAESRVRGTAPVPEPASAMFILSGLIWLSVRRQRDRQEFGALRPSTHSDSWPAPRNPAKTPEGAE